MEVEKAVIINVKPKIEKNYLPHVGPLVLDRSEHEFDFKVVIVESESSGVQFRVIGLQGAARSLGGVGVLRLFKKIWSCLPLQARS